VKLAGGSLPASVAAMASVLGIVARRILTAHDDAVRRITGPEPATVTVGTTEHAAALIR
jgi:hypothetical protein